MAPFAPFIDPNCAPVYTCSLYPPYPPPSISFTALSTLPPVPPLPPTIDPNYGPIYTYPRAPLTPLHRS